jgi:predicted metal-dependent hydrolase
MSPLLEGIALFNERRFWHAHEAWEKLWLRSGGAEKEFLRGLIQLAAAYHHVQRGTLRGAGRLFEAALRRLASAEPSYLGIDRRDAESAAARHREMIERGIRIDPDELPKLGYN